MFLFSFEVLTVHIASLLVSVCKIAAAAIDFLINVSFALAAADDRLEQEGTEGDYEDVEKTVSHEVAF